MISGGNRTKEMALRSGLSALWARQIKVPRRDVFPFPPALRHARRSVSREGGVQVFYN